MPTIDADGDRLRELLENLSKNAVEHAGEGVTITVGPLPATEGTGFFVADDGPGIAPADRDAVFDHGYSTATDGTGFGLSIVRSIVDAHGWQIALGESEVGARFEIRCDPDT